MNLLEFVEFEEQIGRIWHRLIGTGSVTTGYHHYPDAAVSLEDIRVALGVFFRGLGGSPGIAITTGTQRASGHRLKLRQRLGLMAELVSPIECNHERMLLPEILGYFPDKELNRQHYFWLVAFFSRAQEYVDGNSQPIYQSSDPLQADLAYLYHVFRISREVCQRYPGLAHSYQRLCETLPTQRSRQSGTEQEQAIEAIICMLLGQSENNALAQRYFQAMQQIQPDFTVWQAHKNYRTFLPAPLWGKFDFDQTLTQTKPHSLDDSDGNAQEQQSDSLKRKSRRERQDQSMRDDPLLLNRFEKMLSWSEMVNVNRAVQDDDKQSARDAAKALEEITLSPHEQQAATKLKFDLDLSPEDVNPEVLISECSYPEWDYRRKHYHPHQCRVVFQQAIEHQQQWEPDLEARQRFRKIRRQFEALLPKREILRNQLDGSELDMDAVVRTQCDFLATGYRTDQLYLQAQQRSRDLAVTILVDVSLSTDSWVNGRRILDISKEALITLATGLATCRDAFAIYTFTSRKKDYVRITEVKKFDDPFNAKTLRRIASLRPGYYTRMGAALRHTQQILAPRPERHRLMLILTDGKPNDLDYYEGRYGIEDTRQAIIEARRAGLSVFGITIDREAQDYFPYLFGNGGYAIVARPDRLSHVLPSIYQQLVK